MPMYYPPSIKRRRLDYVGRRRGAKAVRGGRGSIAGRMLRMINAPSQVHTFARPGQRIYLTNNATQWFVNGVALSGSSSQIGITQGFGSVGQIVNTLDFGFSQFFQFSFLQNALDLSQLYDNYRIKMVKLKFDLSYNNAPGVQATTAGASQSGINSLPIMHYCIDQDDGTAPTSVGDILQFSKSRSVRLGDKGVIVNFVPRAQGVVSTTNVSPPGTALTPAVGSMMPYGTWLDCQNGATVPHMSFKAVLENLPVGLAPPAVQQNFLITITPVYILECKNVH